MIEIDWADCENCGNTVVGPGHSRDGEIWVWDSETFVCPYCGLLHHSEVVDDGEAVITAQDPWEFAGPVPGDEYERATGGHDPELWRQVARCPACDGAYPCECGTRIHALHDAGHTAHCAKRIVWGDGQCECEVTDA